jgi:hypothetical protein
MEYDWSGAVSFNKLFLRALFWSLLVPLQPTGVACEERLDIVLRVAIRGTSGPR